MRLDMRYRVVRPNCAFILALTVLSLVMVVLIQLYFWSSQRLRPSQVVLERVTMANKVDGVKMILMHSFPTYYEFKPGDHHFKNCPGENRCIMSLDSGDMSKADGIIFFSRAEIRRPPRYKDQVWIYFAVESPIHAYITSFENPEWHYQFNWTMTYRYDSDIQFGYGHIHPRKEVLKPNEQKDYVQIAKRKTKNVAWFVSNCHVQSKRERFVEELNKHIPVDIYGACGSHSCGKNKDVECLEMVERDYRFYLAFENSLCKDYITEKLYNRMKFDVLPIVRGGADYKKIIPVKSIINVWDYSSSAALAKYLYHLAENPEEYADYFKWKNTHYVEEPQDMPLCEVCEKLHNVEKWPNLYEDAQKWWKKGACFEPTDV